MKKFLLSLACVSAMAWSASAAEVTFDFSAQGYADAQEVLSIKVNDEISATLTKGSNNNTPKYYTNGNALRLYAGNTFELTSTNGNITKVVFTMGSNNPFNAAATATPGALDVTTATWTGDAKTFTITNGSGKGHARVEKMTITYGGTGGGEVTPPTPPTPEGPVTFLDETFTSGIPANWTNVKMSGDKQWYQTSYNNNGYAAMTGYKGTQPPFDAWLISPAIDLTKVTDKKLTFDTQVNGYGSTTTVFEAFVMTSNTLELARNYKLNPTIAVAPDKGYSEWVNSGEIDLTPYLNEGTIYIGFRFYATEDANYATWCVDNVKVGQSTEPKPEDKTVADIKGFLDTAYTEANTTISGSVSAVYQNGRYLYIKDNSGVLLVFGDLTEKYTNGMTIPGGITGLYENRTNGQFQMKNLVAETFKAGTAGAAIEPDEIALEELSADMVNNYVVIPGVTITATDNARNFTVTDKTGSTVLYNQFNDERYYDVVTVTPGENLTLKAIVAVYNGNVQLYPVEITGAGGQEVVAAPVFSVAAGTVPAGTKVEITSATEGAAIFYTLDGTEPTIQSTLYNGPITINETTTVKAFAVKEEMVNSAVVTATYTVKVVPAVAETDKFDFVNPTTLNPAQQNPGDGQEGAIVVSDLTFTAGNAAISFTDGSSTTRLYKDYNKGNQLRLYKNGGSIIIKAAEGYILKYVSFVGVKLNTLTENGVALDEAENTLWLAAADATSATFETTTDRVDIFSLTVGLDKVGAVEDINFDANEPVEYYNLQGVRVENPANGLYIRRQGTKATKVLVK